MSDGAARDGTSAERSGRYGASVGALVLCRRTMLSGWPRPRARFPPYLTDTSGMAIWTSRPPWGTIPVVLLYGLTDKKEVVDLFTDQVEAEFAMLDVATDLPDLAEHLEVVEIEGRIVRVVARHGWSSGRGIVLPRRIRPRKRA